MSKWISVRDALPFKGEKVLAFSDLGHQIRVAYKNGFVLTTNYHTGKRNLVTHWMPLPESPE